MGILYRLGLVLALLLACWFGVRQYGETLIQRERAEVAQKAVSGAVARSEQSAKADAQSLDKNRAVLDSVRPALKKAREQNAKNRKTQAAAPVAGCGVGNAPDNAGTLRVLNDAIRASNSVLESPGTMP